MFPSKIILSVTFLGFLAFILNSCGTGADARKYPPQPELRVKKNLEEGRGFRLMDNTKVGGSRNFEFASSNELWRASLDTIDFMPLSSVNYSGGIIVTDWYTNNQNDEEIKISIRFLTNEIRSDALDIKIIKKICDINKKCIISDYTGDLIKELKKKILKTAKTYEVQTKDKNFKPYQSPKIYGTK